MTNRYVDSNATGSPTDGLTWATAYRTLSEASAAGSPNIGVQAGDTVWVSHAHAESTAADLVLDWPGTATSPIRIICADSSAEPPTTLATTAVIETTGATADIFITSSSDFVYIYGMTFRAGVGSSSASDIRLGHGQGSTIYEVCTFYLANTSSSSVLTLAGTGGFGEVVCQHCHFKFSNTGQKLNIGESPAKISGGSVLSGTTPSLLMNMSNSATIVAEGFDMSSMSSTMNLVNNSNGSNFLHFRNCKFPASWTGSVNAGTPGPGSIFEFHNSDSTSTNYRYERKTIFGAITSEVTKVRNGGASNGTTAYSWKMVSNANPEWNHQTLNTAEIVRWNEVTGSPITVAVDILHDGAQGGSPSVNLTDRDIWLEVQYLGTAGYPLGVFATDAASSGSPNESDYLAAAKDQDSSVASWTTTGMSNPVTQKLSVTITPQEKGYIHGIVKMTKASYTVYVDPMLQVS